MISALNVRLATSVLLMGLKNSIGQIPVRKVPGELLTQKWGYNPLMGTSQTESLDLLSEVGEHSKGVILCSSHSRNEAIRHGTICSQLLLEGTEVDGLRPDLVKICLVTTE